jgi:hypothetical protein
MDENVFAFVGGTSPGNILFNFSTYTGLQRTSNPVNGIPGDDAGRVRAANFVTSNPTGSGIARSNQLLATLAFVAVDAGIARITPLLVDGDDEITV